MKNIQGTLHQQNSMLACAETEVLAKNFKDFKLFLNIIKSHFNDFSLVGGAFRAFSNNCSCVVETGFGFFSDMHFDIPNIKSYIKAISTLDKKSSITLKTDDTSITFTDREGDFQFSRPNHEYLDNKFVSDKDMEETVLKNVDPNRLIVSEAIPKKIVSRINRVSHKLNSDSIYCKHKKNNLNRGFLSIAEESGDSEFKLELQKPLLIPMKKGHCFRLNILPSIFNKDDLYIKCYFTDDKNIFTMYSTKVNDLFVNIYSKSELIEETKCEY